MTRSSYATDALGRPLGQVLESLLLDQRLAILEQVAAQLRGLHEQQQWYGALGLDTVMLTDAGQVRLAPLEHILHRRSLAQSIEHGESFDEPCAAPEQYVQDALQPAGPWTDVYGYAALRWHLTTGAPLMAAPWRYLSDPVQEGEDMDGDVQAMMRGLSLDLARRPQSMLSYARLERLREQPEPEPDDGVGQAAPVLRRARPAWLIGAVLLLLAGSGLGYWMSESKSPMPSEPTSTPLLAESSAAEPLMTSTLPAPAPASESAPAPEPELEPVPEPEPMEAFVAAPLDTEPAAEIVAAHEPQPPVESEALPPVAQLEPVAARPPAPPPSKGSVALDVRPWGEIYVNGRKQGVSPPLKSLSLAAGTHRIVIKNAGLPEYSATIQVRPGRTATVNHDFR